MKAAFIKKRRSTRSLERCIDPRLPLVGVCDMILTSLKAAGLGAEPGSSELNEAWHRVLVLLRHVRRWNGMPFWKCLTVPKAYKIGDPEIIQDQRNELLAIARDNLQGGPATRADIVAAMDVLHEVVTSMNTMFAVGRVAALDEPEESWALDRYTCAALLPTLAEQLENFWVGLRKKIAQQDPDS